MQQELCRHTHTHTRGSRDSSPLHWDLEPLRERQVSTEDKGSIEDEKAGNGRERVLTLSECVMNRERC